MNCVELPMVVSRRNGYVLIHSSTCHGKKLRSIYECSNCVVRDCSESSLSCGSTARSRNMCTQNINKEWKKQRAGENKGRKSERKKRVTVIIWSGSHCQCVKQTRQSMLKLNELRGNGLFVSMRSLMTDKKSWNNTPSERVYTRVIFCILFSLKLVSFLRLLERLLAWVCWRFFYGNLLLHSSYL